MQKKEKILKTTTSAKVTSPKTGQQSSGSGLEGLGNSMQNLEPSQIEVVASMIRHRPTLFVEDVPESLVYLMYRINFLKPSITKTELAQLKKAERDCKKVMDQATVQDAQVMIETICSTYSCDAPNELGLNTYWGMVKKYPASFFPLVTIDILSTYEYPRLPVPKVFVEKFESLNKQHWAFYYKLKEIVSYAEQLTSK